MNHPGRLQPDPGPALLDLYDVPLPEVYGYLLSRCGRRALAEDLTADTFLAAVEAVRKEPPPELSVAWLVGVARHKLADHWRRAAREQRGLQAMDGNVTDAAEDPWDERVDALLAREVLERLGPHHRAALTLRYLDGLPVPQVKAPRAGAFDYHHATASSRSAADSSTPLTSLANPGPGCGVVGAVAG